MSKLLIGVLGSADCHDEELELAERVGAAIARAGAVLVCGAGTGVMEAACKGARSAGGLTLGLLASTDPAEANRFVDVPIATGFGEARNILIVRASGAVIAVGGEWGTLSEIAFALKAGKTVLGLNTWELHRGGRKMDGIIEVDSPEEAVRRAVEAATRRPVEE
jgi:uncharacterized protein (TIGR00725 family)